MDDSNKNLKICGHILSSDSYSFFALQCTECKATYGQWTSFLRHLEQEHGGFKVDVEDEITHNFDESEIEFKVDDIFNQIDNAENLEMPFNDDERSIYFETKEEMDVDDEGLMIEVMQVYEDKPINDYTETAVKRRASSVESVVEDNFSIDDNKPLEDSVDVSQKFSFDLCDSKKLVMSLDFLKMIQAHPLFWDPRHEHFANPNMRFSAQLSIRSIFKEKNIDISENDVHATISSIVKNYRSAQKKKNAKGKVSYKEERLLRKCAFLEEALEAVTSEFDYGAAKFNDDSKNDLLLEPASSTESLDEDNMPLESLLESLQEEGSLRKFKFNLSVSEHLLMSLDFMKEFETHRVLWDPKHKKYRNPRMRSLAQSQIKKFFKDKKIYISDKVLQKTISTLLRNYKLALQEKREKGTVDVEAARLLRKCAYLEDVVKLDSVSNDEDDIPDFSDQAKDDDSDELGNVPRPASSKLNRINFSASDPIFLDFIERYKESPLLWDTTLYNYNHRAERRAILGSWSDEFMSKYNQKISYEELSFSLIEFRRIYYKNLQRREDNVEVDELGKFILEKGSFLPPKSAKQSMQCPHCRRNFLLEHTLKRHIYVDHGIGEKPFKCSYCDESFDDYLIHRRHEHRFHLKDYRYNCEYCAKAFFTRDEMERHVMKHTGEKRFVCELCGRGFSKKTNLNLHNTRIHLRQRNYPCTMCPKAFYTNGLLQDHLNAHLNIRDKICKICGKGFTSHHSLIRHRQIHSEVKKYACKLCDARFHQFVGLNSHMKNTHKFVRGKNETASDDEGRHLE